MLFELILNGLVVGSKLGLASLGFAVIYYTSREFHVAYGVLLALAGYIALVLIDGYSVPAVVAVAASCCSTL